MPEDDLSLLIRAARDAGQIAMRFWKRDPRVWDKDDNAGPVTEADLAVNTQLATALRGERPAYGWLSEESPDDPSRLDKSRCFIVDPIDGTRAFIDGHDGFSHALAVAENGRITAGVVYLPAQDVLYAASIDGYATRNDAPIAPTDADVAGARVLTARASSDPVFWRDGAVPAFRRAFRPSLAWRLCLAADGRFDAALSLRPAWEWDIAAASLIADRAGCVTTDMHGKPMRFNSADARVGGLIVAGPRLHRQIVDALAPQDGSQP